MARDVTDFGVLGVNNQYRVRPYENCIFPARESMLPSKAVTTGSISFPSLIEPITALLTSRELKKPDYIFPHLSSRQLREQKKDGPRDSLTSPAGKDAASVDQFICLRDSVLCVRDGELKAIYTVSWTPPLNRAREIIHSRLTLVDLIHTPAIIAPTMVV